MENNIASLKMLQPNKQKTKNNNIKKYFEKTYICLCKNQQWSYQVYAATDQQAHLNRLFVLPPYINDTIQQCKTVLQRLILVAAQTKTKKEKELKINANWYPPITNYHVIYYGGKVGNFLQVCLNSKKELSSNVM